MKNKAGARSGSQSMRTFWGYAGLVFFLIIISLSIKTVSIINKSKYHGNNFILSINSNKSVKKIIGFNPSENTLSVVTLQGKNIDTSSLGSEVGVIPDATLDVENEAYTDESISTLLTQNLMRSSDSQYEKLTILDKLRLIYFAKNSTQKRGEVKIAGSATGTDDTLKSLFTDEKILEDNVSIEIVNSTKIAGLGQRAERILTNIGGNIVAVSTSRSVQKKSKISYYGESTYTLNRIKNLFNIPVEKNDIKSIADIVIIIGEDIKL